MIEHNRLIIISRNLDDGLYSQELTNNLFILKMEERAKESNRFVVLL